MKLMPASSAAWMIRTDSSWSVFPHSPNIIAPRQSGLTLTPVAPRLRSCMAPHLVDRREAGHESVARCAQVEPPDANALLARKPRGLFDVVVQCLRPVPQRFGVVVLEALDVLDLEAGALERELDARERQRVAVREHVALGERPGIRRVRVESGDPVVEQAGAVGQQA